MNVGWADSISKILKSKKPKRKKSLVLSKAKKLTDLPKTEQKPVGFQIETVDGEVKEEKVEVTTITEDKPIKKKVSLIKFHLLNSKKSFNCREENCQKSE